MRSITQVFGMADRWEMQGIHVTNDGIPRGVHIMSFLWYVVVRMHVESQGRILRGYLFSYQDSVTEEGRSLPARRTHYPLRSALFYN